MSPAGWTDHAVLVLAPATRVVGTTIWVGIDASRREWGDGLGPASWVVFCLLLWIVAFPIYLVKRNNAPLKDAFVPTVVAAPSRADAIEPRVPSRS